jgi:hypothetical protein
VTPLPRLPSQPNCDADHTVFCTPFQATGQTMRSMPM